MSVRKTMDSKVITTPNKIECPFAMKWTIDEEELQDSEVDHVTTEIFDATNIPGVEYFLSIYPYGKDEENDGKVGIYLQLELKRQKKVKANFKFMIESAGISKEVNYVYKESIGYGNSFFCFTDELFDPTKNFVVDGKLVIKCEGIMSVEKEIVSRKRKWKGSALGRQFWQGESKDFTIMVGAKSIQVHKNVLADRSPVFKAMFDHKLKEASENQMEITDFPYEIVEAALQLLYDRMITSLMVQEKAGVLQFLDKYQIQNLKDMIEASLLDEISVSTVCSIANASLISNSIKLQEKCMDFLVDCGKNEVYVKDFDDLDNEFGMKVLKLVLFKTIET